MINIQPIHETVLRGIREELTSLNKTRNGLCTQLEGLREGLHWYETTTLADLERALIERQNEGEQIKNELSGISVEQETVAKSLNELRSRVKTFFNPKNWFDSTQWKLREQVLVFQNKERRLNETKQLSIRRLDAANTKITQAETNIHRHKEFNRDQHVTLIEEQSAKVKELEEKIGSAEERKRKIDGRLFPICQELEKYDAEIKQAKGIITIAEGYQQGLRDADNSYERREIHQKCEAAFGTGYPEEVLRDARPKLNRLTRDRAKAAERLEEAAKRVSCVIETLIIDGNNLCYEDKTFIGLCVLEVLVPLLKKMHTIILVFDAGIRRKVQASQENLQEQFGVKVHITHGGKLADETLISLASADPGAFILSNDRFGDFSDSSAVRENRLIKHEIINGRVLIHDLDINIRF